MIAWTIEAAHASKIDLTIVSTDDETIATVARSYAASVPFIRPPELATDKAKSSDVVLHALKWFEATVRIPDAVVLLQPTSPLRTATHINAALDEFADSGKDSLISLRRSGRDGKVMVPNGCIYIASRDLAMTGQLTKNPVLWLMDETMPDVDTPEDFAKAEKLMNRRLHPPVIDWDG